MGKNLLWKKLHIWRAGHKKLPRKHSFQKFSIRQKKVVFILLGDCPGHDPVVSLQKNYFARLTVSMNYIMRWKRRQTHWLVKVSGVILQHLKNYQNIDKFIWSSWSVLKGQCHEMVVEVRPWSGSLALN
jgi:hypothetical protein